MQIGKNKIVSIDYSLTNSQGELLDTSKGRAPLAYLHGVGGIIPGLETALEGKSAGENFTISIPPEEAYGQKDQRLIEAIPRERFAGVDKIEVGMQFQAQSKSGQKIVQVVGVTDEHVTVDANHPLAGVTLNFDVTVVDVRDATEEEIGHGHVHGPGGHHH